MKRAAAFLICLIVAAPAFATAQTPDVIRIGGKRYDLNANPLDAWLAANPDREIPSPGFTSSGLWRGYIATWSIRDAKLYLDDVRVPTDKWLDDVPESEQTRSVMKDLFGDASPRIATWVTANLIVPTGDMVDYVHMGYASTYSSYFVVTAVEGAVQKQRAMNQAQFEAFRREQFAAYRKTPEFAQELAEAMKGEDPMSEEMAVEFISQFASGTYLSMIFRKE